MRLAGAGILGLVLLAGLAVAVHWYLELRYLESTDDAYVRGTLVLLSARVGGTVIEVPVEENQRVHAGEVLVRLDPSNFDVHVARAQADLDAARNRMEAARAARWSWERTCLPASPH